MASQYFPMVNSISERQSYSFKIARIRRLSNPPFYPLKFEKSKSVMRKSHYSYDVLAVCRACYAGAMVNPASINYYFGNKGGLFRQMLE